MAPTAIRTIQGLSDLALLLKAAPEELEELLIVGDRAYRCYTSRVLGNRVIQEPAPGLKTVQKRILRVLGPAMPAHKAAHGGVKGRSAFTNAKVHFPSRCVSKIDIRRFFPSVTRGMIEDGLSRQGLMECTVCSLTDLLSLRNQLPTGAPTSPWVGNLVLQPVDVHMTRFCGKLGVRYSRYIDDITLSGGRHCEAYVECRRLLEGSGFQLSEKKCVRMCDPKRFIEVTGYVVNGKEIRLTRDYKRSVRSMVNALVKSIERGASTEHEAEIVEGHLAHIYEISPDLARFHALAIAEARSAAERKPAACSSDTDFRTEAATVVGTAPNNTAENTHAAR